MYFLLCNSILCNAFILHHVREKKLYYNYI